MGYNPEENDDNKLYSGEVNLVSALEYERLALELKTAKSHTAELVKEFKSWKKAAADFEKENEELAEKLKAAEWALGCGDDYLEKANLEKAELGRKLKAHQIQVVDLERELKAQKSLAVEIELDKKSILFLGEDLKRSQDLNKTLAELNKKRRVEARALLNEVRDENITLCADLKAMTGRFDDAAKLNSDLMDERDMLKATVIDQAMKLAGVKL